MLHQSRVWQVTLAADVDELTRNLAEGGNWTLCTGFRYRGWLFLNDSTSEDAVQEWAVVREADHRQVESITFGWCDDRKTRGYIQQAIAGKLNYPMGTVSPERLQTPLQHERYPFCA